MVNASRIPPRPLAGQRLERAGQQLEAWKPCCPALLALLPSCSAALLLCFLLCSAFRSALLSAQCSAMLSALLSALLCSPLCFQQLLSTLVSALLYALLLLLKIVQHRSIWDPKYGSGTLIGSTTGEGNQNRAVDSSSPSCPSASLLPPRAPRPGARAGGALGAHCIKDS